MRSKLQIYCEGVMEAAWLAAAIVIPLFFNISSTQTFEPDKAAILRFLAVLAGAAFLLKRLSARIRQTKADEAELSFRSLVKQPLVFFIIVLAVLYTLSSIFSIVPAISWLGLYKRAQGTITFYCYLILFLVVFCELRSQAQVYRLQYAFILTSLPAAGYGILQYFGADPLPWSNPIGNRPSGSMGNPIFLGAFLAMVVPLTFSRLVYSVRLLRTGAGHRQGVVLATCCSLALILQGLGLLCTQSRGPVLGLAISAYICLFLLLVLKRAPTDCRGIFPAAAIGVGILGPAFCIAVFLGASGYSMKAGVAGLGLSTVGLAAAYWMFWRTQWGRRWLWLTWLAQTAMLIVFFSVVPRQTLAESPAGSPFARLTQVSGNSVDVRRCLWQTALLAARSGSPSSMPEGMQDRFRHLRPIIGYGPENAWFVANRYATPELVRLHTRESVDRMHNDTVDHLITLGLMGAITWLIVIGAALYYSLRFLDFCPGAGGKNHFILFSTAGVLAGIILPWAAGYAYLIGVGVVAGLLAGVIALAAWQGFRTPATAFRGDDVQVLVFCCLGAIIAHITETAVGIAVTSTRTYFFILIAMVAAISVRDLSPVEEPAKQRSVKAAGRRQNPAFNMALLSCFAVLALSWEFFLNRSINISAWDLFTQAWLSGYPGLPVKFGMPGTLILLLLTIAGSLGLIGGGIEGAKTNKYLIQKAIWSAVGLLLTVWLAIAFITAILWTSADASSPPSFAMEAEARIVSFLAALFLLILAAAWRIVASDPARYRAAAANHARSSGLAVIVMLGAVAGIHFLVSRPARADAVYRVATIFEESGSASAAIKLYDRAIRLAPGVVPYWISKGLAQAYAGAGEGGGVQASIQSLQHAVDLDPLDLYSNRVLASVYMTEAERTEDPRVRSGQLQKAIDLYKRTARLAPNYPDAYCDLGRCYFLLGDHEKAGGLYDKSLRMNPSYARTHMFLGEMHYRLNNLELARRDFKTAADLDPRNLEAWKNLGFVLAKLGRKEEAIRVELEILPRAPKDVVLLSRLSALYFSTGNAEAGHAYARRAFDATPSSKRGTYEQFAADLQNQ